MKQRLLVVVVLLLCGGWIGGCEEHSTRLVLQPDEPAARAGGQGQDGLFHQYPDPYTAAFWAEPVGAVAIRVHVSTYRYVWRWQRISPIEPLSPDYWQITVPKLHPTGNVITTWIGTMYTNNTAPLGIT